MNGLLRSSLHPKGRGGALPTLEALEGSLTVTATCPSLASRPVLSGARAGTLPSSRCLSVMDQVDPCAEQQDKSASCAEA